MKIATNNQSLLPLEKRLGFRFRHRRWLEEALTHRSWLNEHRQTGIIANERLEFLGDAVLELWASDRLFKNYPQKAEGELTNIRANLVCRQSLAHAARRLKLGQFLRLSRGEELNGGRTNEALLENSFEAIIGAIYSDQGLEATFHFLDRQLLEQLHRLASQRTPLKDAKTQLQEKSQALYKITPRYQLLTSHGPDHKRIFTSAVFLGRKLIGRGQGQNKRQAEEAAAKQALTQLKKQSTIRTRENAKN